MDGEGNQTSRGNYKGHAVQKIKTPIRVPFNKNRQYVLFHVADDSAKFKRRNECYAYYIEADVRHLRRGLFGHIHLSELNRSPLAHELVAHEIEHLVFDWVLSHKGMTFNRRNEERISDMVGEIHRRFWRKYERLAGR